MGLFDDRKGRGFPSAVVNSLKNQFFVTLPVSHWVLTYYPRETLTFNESLFLLPLFVILGDVYFYMTHRLMHTPLLWRLHKHHHRTSVSVSRSLDASVMEHCFCNLGSFAAGTVILSQMDYVPHVYVLYIWTAVATWGSCTGHSNGNAPGDNEEHLMHHKHPAYNYGFGLYVFDRLFGTYKTCVEIK